MSCSRSEKKLFLCKIRLVSILGHPAMPLLLGLFYIQFLGNTFRFYIVYTYCARSETCILLLGSEAFIGPKWAHGQGTKDACCLASSEKVLLQPQDVVVDSMSSSSFQNHTKCQSLCCAAGDRKIILTAQHALPTNSASDTVVPCLTYQASLNG